MDVELRHLRAFLAVARNLSFTQAARELSVSQPCLTRSIQRLESSLGSRLLDRTSRIVSLTPTGQYLLDHTQRLLAMLDSTLNAVRNSGTLRLGFSWLLPDPWAQQAIADFESSTSCQVELLRRDTPTAGIELGEVDVAVVRRIPMTKDVVVIPLFEEPRVAAVSITSPLARRRSLNWREFKDWPLVVNTVSGSTRPDDWEEGGAPEQVVTCGNYDEWLELVAANRGVGVAPSSTSRRSHHSGVRFLSIKSAPPICVYLVHSPNAQHPLLGAFLESAMVNTRQGME
ncbi:LysR family transcriptional regulator [Streptomyces pathocidini]|uniref:LysR family transcriptional regulator n=1 Tax=Streptomyces pathocidini TaxID=1650571 RepID=A0ABW7UZP9_9ACTN|nr:LysR family transcriptional regulator [Streptomyces pathocidini]